MTAFVLVCTSWCAINVIAVAWCLAFNPSAVESESSTRLVDLFLSFVATSWGLYLLAKA